MRKFVFLLSCALWTIHLNANPIDTNYFDIYKNDRGYKLAIKNKKKLKKREEQNVAQERSWNQRNKRK